MPMNEALSEIRTRLGEENLTNSCGIRNCRVDDIRLLPSDQVVINVDSAFDTHNQTGKHCDRILFYLAPAGNVLVVVLIELKGGTFDSAPDVAKQLQGGADFVKRFIPAGIKTTCVPIVFHGNGNHQAQFKKLRRETVNFGGGKFPISTAKCNAPKNLARVLNRAKVLPQLDN